MPTPTRQHAPYIVAAIILIVVLAAEFYNASQCDGHWVFALDDSYIHLAIARNFVDNGIWGAVPGEFGATSSAPLYTLLLAGGFLTGVQSEIWAWIFSLAGGMLAAFLLTRRVQECFPRERSAIAIGLVVSAAIWLPEIMAGGMEHTLHISAVLIVLLLLERVLSNQGGKYSELRLIVALFVAGGLRYETLFLLPPLCWVIWRAGKRNLAWAALGAGALPAIILGVLYSSYGAMFFPNSVLLKGVDIEGGIGGHLARLFRQLDEPSRFILLAIAAFNIFELSRRSEKPDAVAYAPSIIYIGTMVAHTALARPDRRYLGYLLAMGVWAAVPPLCRWYSQMLEWLESAGNRKKRTMPRAAIAGLLIVLIVPFSEPLLDLGRLPKLGRDIYSQQYQMARFFSTYYDGQRVGLNDIGAVAWAGKNPILDFWGLADNEVARLRLEGRLEPGEMARLARERDARVIAIYSRWFTREKRLPEQWQMVAVWHIPASIQVNVASNTVEFYATRPDAVEPLRQNLEAFKAQLPADVTVIM